jgi:hypothetical protein
LRDVKEGCRAVLSVIDGVVNSADDHYTVAAEREREREMVRYFQKINLAF